jgi:hypothetical protein
MDKDGYLTNTKPAHFSGSVGYWLYIEIKIFPKTVLGFDDSVKSKNKNVIS